MVGEGVLLGCLTHPSVESVLVVGRRPCNVKHEKLKELIHKDFFDYSSAENRLKGYNACFFCLGVSSVGKSEQEYTRTTYDLTMQAGKTLARLNPDMTFCYISGTGTDSTEKGRLMWARVKGKTENDLSKLPFRDVYLFRPGLIKPVEGQKNVPTFLRIVTAAYPIFKALAPRGVCTLEDLGLAMIASAASGYQKKILENVDIASLANSSRKSL